ncbi:MAG: DUF177 domain-containing protein [Pseudolysinimonas sp.]|uniref:YceD family protein n=1 Tax=Pseudolysinimonas sp. TaxID=2680009 RepID=UPI0032659602
MSVSPYLVNVRDLVHRPGDMRERTLDFPAPEQLGEGAAVVRAGENIHIDLRFEGLHEGILVSAEVDTVAYGECVRCLDPVTIQVEVEFQEVFAYSVTEAFDFVVRDDQLDLEPVVRDAVVLSLPFQPVCRPDCSGLDPVTGERLPDGFEQEIVEAHDPRWAALKDLQVTTDSTTDTDNNEKR